jgi:hypothetical protein
MARTQRYKLSLYPDPAMNLLFDLQSDPHEEQNRFLDPALQAVRDDLTKRIDAYYCRYCEESHKGTNFTKLPTYNPRVAWKS